MAFDFALVLVILTAVTGVVWGIDKLFFERGRRAAALAAAPAAEAGSAVVVKDPVLVEYAKSFFPVLLIILLFRSFLFEPFKIPSGSMMPTLLIGDFILVNKYSYGLRVPVLNTRFVSIGEPVRGDVVVFKYPKQPSINYVKRLVGLPGDEITYRNRQLFINGKPAELKPVFPYVGAGSNAKANGALIFREVLDGLDHQILVGDPSGGRGPEGTWVVPEGHYFMMGDNRDNSEDSRVWGAVPERLLVGRASLVWMHWDWGLSGFVEPGRIGAPAR